MRLLRTLALILALAFPVATLPLMVGCGKPFVTLTPVAQTAFKTTQVIKALDLIRDTAIAGNNTTPPVFSEKTTGQVVTWHRATIIVVNAAQAGWQTATVTALDTLSKQLAAGSAEQAQLVPYITLAKTLLTEVTK